MEHADDEDLEKFLPKWYMEMRKQSKKSGDNFNVDLKGRDMKISRDEYADLIKRREDLEHDIKIELQKLEKVAFVIHKVISEDPIERRARGESAEQLFEAIGVKELDCEGTKQKILELAEINLKLRKAGPR